MTAGSIARRVSTLAPVRIVLAVLAVLCALTLTRWLVVAPLRGLLDAGGESRWELLFRTLYALGALFGYAAFVRLVEARPVGELSFSKAGRELGAGFLLGTGLFCATIAPLWVLGFYDIFGFRSPSVLVLALAYSVFPAVAEEVLYRGILFRVAEEWTGTWAAVALSAILFGLYHAGQPGASASSTAAIALEAGVLLAACYVLTRRLWLAIGVHVAWNFTQAGVFSVIASGIGFEGLLRSRLSGPEVLTGGAFGAEASAIAVTVCLTVGAWLLFRARERGRIVSPFGRHRRARRGEGGSRRP